MFGRCQASKVFAVATVLRRYSLREQEAFSATVLQRSVSKKVLELALGSYVVCYLDRTQK